MEPTTEISSLTQEQYQEPAGYCCECSLSCWGSFLKRNVPSTGALMLGLIGMVKSLDLNKNCDDKVSAQACAIIGIVIGIFWFMHGCYGYTCSAEARYKSFAFAEGILSACAIGSGSYAVSQINNSNC